MTIDKNMVFASIVINEVLLELESCAISKAGSGPEAQEGMAAFLEKRKPNFKEAVMSVKG